MPDSDEQLINSLLQSIEQLQQRVNDLEVNQTVQQLEDNQDLAIRSLQDEVSTLDGSLEQEYPFDVPIRHVISSNTVFASRISDDTISLHADFPPANGCTDFEVSQGEALTVIINEGTYVRNGVVLDFDEAEVTVTAGTTNFVYLEITSVSNNPSVKPNAIRAVNKLAAITNDQEGRFLLLATVTTDSTTIIDIDTECRHIDDFWLIPDGESDKAAGSKISTLNYRQSSTDETWGNEAHADEAQINDADAALNNSSYVDTLSAKANKAWVAILDAGSGFKKITWIQGERDFEGISASGQWEVGGKVSYDPATGKWTQPMWDVRVRAGIIADITVASVNDITTAVECSTSP